VELTYDDFISQNLRVMDQTAITHCRDRSLPILVFNFQREGNIQRAIAGEKIGTLIHCQASQP
jgi:uridylate kinase